MRRIYTKFYTIASLLFIGLLLVQFACGTNSSVDSKADAVNGEQSAASGATPSLEEIHVQEIALLKAHNELHKRILDLRAQYDALPAVVRKNAVNCDQLEAQLDGHIEKGNFRIEALKKMIHDTELLMLTGARHSTDQGEMEEAGKGIPSEGSSQFEVVLAEFKNDLDPIEAECSIMKKAIAQLEASIPTEGKGVVLFE